MLTLKEVKKNPLVLEFIDQAEKKMEAQHYTDHGLNHSSLVAARARTVAREIGLNSKYQELSSIAGFCHDFGNFLSRTYHNYLGALVFQQIFAAYLKPKELSLVMQAIVNHDKYEMDFSDKVSAVTVLADKSDVRRSRVTIKDIKKIKSDIHNRVNYAVTAGKLGIDKRKKRITLSLRIDTNFVPVIEYFEIFTERMVYCRKAAQFLGYKFGLVINNFKLL
ncbi:MAG: phosphohydrolase [Parcubacteria group bacterium]|nr:phosphohydrolase [Parcubacteria group bacterium]|tara:strand:- start:19501 stop:20163 length:663 start_codon:yes stop_codon:yes gene_type:complete